jgi:hypothetical protein
MMTFVIGLVLSSGAAAGDDQQVSGPPVLRVGVFGYRADGSSALAAWETELSTNSVVSMTSLCKVTAGSSGPPADATDAWRFSGKVQRIDDDEAVLELEWQRIRDRGQPVTAPAGNGLVTLRAGEKVVLDQVIPDAPSQCSIVGASFEARYTRSRIGAPELEVENAPPASPSSSPRTRSSGGGARSGLPRSANFLIKALDVNLWLVHTAPGRPDAVLHQTLLATDRGADFAFSPITVSTSDGAVVVQVTGSFAVTSGGSGDQLVFATNRRVTSARLDLPVRDGVPDSQGNSRTAVPMPGPDDVLSFEMPPLRVKGQPPLPDQFSVRVRITPSR